MGLTFARAASVVALVATLAGCTTTVRTTEAYEAALDTWLGDDINDLVDQNGYADRTLVAPNGNTVYVYESSVSSTTTVPVRSFVDGSVLFYRTNTSELYCDTFIEVGDKNRIVSWRYEGNDCKAEDEAATEEQRRQELVGGSILGGIALLLLLLFN